MFDIGAESRDEDGVFADGGRYIQLQKEYTIVESKEIYYSYHLLLRRAVILAAYDRRLCLEKGQPSETYSATASSAQREPFAEYRAERGPSVAFRALSWLRTRAAGQ